MRAVFETLGMQDVVAKSIGTSNPYNVVRATFDALKRQDSPRSVAARRNVKVSALQARRRDVDADQQRPIERDPGAGNERRQEGGKDRQSPADRQPAAPASRPARDAGRA